MKKKILVAGILDTKGNEIKYLAKKVEEAGAEAKVLELSVGKQVGWADIDLETLLREVNRSVEEINQVDRFIACAWVTEGAVKYVRKLYENGEVDGVIAYGGSMGASIATAVMQSLPIGVPKFMLTTMASGDIRSYVGTKDIIMMYPIAEAGLNTLTKRILTNAAYGVVGMANAPMTDQSIGRPLIGCMMFGVTTPCTLRSAETMEKHGYDVLINHAIGTGGKSMEELISDGFVKGLLDITTHEIADEMLGGVLGAGPDRLTAAGKMGIPQVIAPGGLDLINFGPKSTIPDHFIQQTNLPGRSLYEHNPNVTCVGVLPDEAYDIAVHMANKLNDANGPTVICVPMRGWGACDTHIPNKDLGWAGPSSGPSWVSAPEKPEWSLRSFKFIEGLKSAIDFSRDNLEVLVVDMHLNQPEFADLMTDILLNMLSNKWKKGQFKDNLDIETLLA